MAMVFGGVMDALITATIARCISLNLTASGQYASIVVPGKIFKSTYNRFDLAPENLSRSIDDSGTITSVLVPWNACGAYISA
jgi:Na+:H+ antiporter, NhaC family